MSYNSAKKWDIEIGARRTLCYHLFFEGGRVLLTAPAPKHFRTYSVPSAYSSILMFVFEICARNAIVVGRHVDEKIQMIFVFEICGRNATVVGRHVHLVATCRY